MSIFDVQEAFVKRCRYTLPSPARLPYFIRSPPLLYPLATPTLFTGLPYFIRSPPQLYPLASPTLSTRPLNFIRSPPLLYPLASPTLSARLNICGSIAAKAIFKKPRLNRLVCL